MRTTRAVSFGLLGAGAISAVTALLRLVGVPIQIELLVGTAFGVAPGPAAFALGFATHLAMGGAFGLLYAWLFETVWDHGGAATGAILAMLHASLLGMAIGLTPQFHPYVPERIADPGAYFANAGVAGVVAFFAAHILYGAIVGGGYGHVAAEREWGGDGRTGPAQDRHANHARS